MKKFLFITAALCFCLQVECSPQSVLQEKAIMRQDSVVLAHSDGCVLNHDSVFTIHPNAEDSAFVVTIINGALNVATVYRPLGVFHGLKPWLSGVLATITLGIWRRKEIRRMKKKGVLQHDYGL